jgi:hypothetical protein
MKIGQIYIDTRMAKNSKRAVKLLKQGWKIERVIGFWTLLMICPQGKNKPNKIQYK